MTVVNRIRDHAVRAPAHAAWVENDRAGDSHVVSYAEAVGNFDAIAKRLVAEGLAPGDRCGLIAKQGGGFIELALGVLAAGGCLVPIPDDHKGEVLTAFGERTRLHRLVLEADSGFEHRPLGQSRSGDAESEAAYRALSPAYLRFTSGTTSERKGVILGHRAIEARLAAANRVLRISPEDRVLWLLPMAHHFVVSILLYLSNGASVLLPASPLARNVLEFAKRERPTVIYASPHHYRLLAKDTSEFALDEVRLAISTAEGLRESIASEFTERFGLSLVQALGIIEVGLPVVNLDSAATKPTALGRPLPGYEVWLRGDDGKPVSGRTSPDRTGEICIRGPGMLDAYLDPWLPAAICLEPDGFRTGDQGWFDSAGDLHLAGRRENRICMAGMKFFSEEVEAVLDTHPGVAESRVFAIEHAHLGEVPYARIVSVDPDASPARSELIRHCRGALPAYKIPREFQLVESLERTQTGKLRRG
ncbi:MAG: class I adenylate-forming enzyme family protein [Myxococcota bacterium]